MHAYIYDITDVKKSSRNSNVSYYNFKLKSPKKHFRGVSYRMDLKNAFEMAEQKRSPIKLSGVKRKLNRYDQHLEDIEVGK